MTMDTEIRIARMREKLERLRARKMEADRRSAWWLMAANDIEEKQIGPLEARIRDALDAAGHKQWETP